MKGMACRLIQRTNFALAEKKMEKLFLIQYLTLTGIPLVDLILD